MTWCAPLPEDFPGREPEPAEEVDEDLLLDPDSDDPMAGTRHPEPSPETRAFEEARRQDRVELLNRPPSVPSHLRPLGPIVYKGGLNRHPLSDPGRRADAIATTRSQLTVLDQVGLALRMDRDAAGESQRAYAERRGVSRDMIRRAEGGGTGRQSLDTVRNLLAGTGFELAVIRSGSPASRPSDEIDPERLVAKDLAGRALPAHLPIELAPNPGMVWLFRNGGWWTKKVAPAWTYRRDREP